MDLFGIPGQPGPHTPPYPHPLQGVVVGIAESGLTLVNLDSVGEIEATLSTPHLGVAVVVDAETVATLPNTLPVGTRCLVAFAGGQLDGAWIIGIAP